MEDEVGEELVLDRIDEELELESVEDEVGKKLVLEKEVEIVVLVVESLVDDVTIP